MIMLPLKVHGVDKSISKSKYTDLLGYYNQSGEEIHSLKDVLVRYKSDPNIKFMIETRLVKLIERYHLQKRILFESFSLKSLQKLVQLTPAIPRPQLGGDYHDIGDN